MTDPRFFKRAGPFTLQEIAERSGARLHENADPEKMINDVAPLNAAGADDLSFLDNIKYRDAFTATKAGACIVSKDMIDNAPADVSLIVSETPYKAYAHAAQAFYPEILAKNGIADSAQIDDSAIIGADVCIGAGAIIKAHAEIGAGTVIEPNAVISDNVVIGAHCSVGAGTVISHSLIGDHVRIYPGCCIGQDGFGFAMAGDGYVKVPQLGRVIIGDSVEIGANTTIDRGAGPDTEIGTGTWIDNLVQIGHNVKIGRMCVIVAQAGISGSTVLEDYVVLGGQTGVAGHLQIGKGARIGAQSGVMRNVPAGAQYIGSPAMPDKQFMRQIATLNRMIKKDKNESDKKT